MNEPLVKDLMLTQIMVIRPEATVREAVEMLRLDDQECSLSEVPGARSLMVQDAGGSLVGMVTMLDILEGIEPPYLRLERTYLAGITWDGLFEEAIERAESRTVKEIMTPRSEFEVLSAGDRIMKALELMVEDRTTLLPVCEEGKLVGEVRLFDVFQEAAKRMLAAKEDR